LDEILKKKKKCLNEIQNERKQLECEKANWIEEQNSVKNMMTDELFHLNIGGLYFPTVSKNLLTSVSGTGIANMFSGRHELKK
jgi:hypothetical protein